MRDLATEVREYVDRFDEPFDPAALIEKAQRVTTISPSAPRGPSLRLGLAVGIAAAVIMLVLVGGALLIGGPFSGDQTPVVTQPLQPSSTIPQVTTTPGPGSTLPPATTTPPPDTTVPAPATTVPEASPVTYYTAEDGLPEGYPQAVTVTEDGAVWVEECPVDAETA